MKRSSFFLLIIIFVSSCGTTSKVPRNLDEAPRLDKVVQAIQREYSEALTELAKESINDIKATEAEISLKIAKETSGNGEIKVLIFKPSRKQTWSRETTVTYTLSNEESDKGGADTANLLANHDLKNVIVSAARNFHTLQATIGDLTKESFDVELSFSVEVVNGGALDFEVWGLSISGGVERTRSVEHGLTITFKQGKAASK